MDKQLFADHEAQEYFFDRYSKASDEFRSLMNLFNELERDVCNRPLDYDGQVIHFLINTIWDDLTEFVCLYANGLPLGARKILRAMFEHTVHIAQFEKVKEDIEKFWNYGFLDEEKLVNFWPESYSEEKQKEVRKYADDFRDQYKIPVCERCKYAECEPCKRLRLAPSWMGKRDLISLAQALNIPKAVIFTSYYIPLQETHPKIQSLNRRRRKNELGRLEYFHDQTTEKDDNSMMSVHYLVLFAMASYVDFFKIEGGSEKLLEFGRRFTELWPS